MKYVVVVITDSTITIPSNVKFTQICGGYHFVGLCYLNLPLFSKGTIFLEATLINIANVVNTANNYKNDQEKTDG